MIRIGVIGAGGRGGRHLEELADIDEASVVAICDIDRETATAVADTHDATPYTDHETMYNAEPDLDAVFVGLPPFAHADQEIMAAERGIHLFIEKPLALNAAKASEIGTAIERNGVISSVSYQFRYAEAIQRSAELVEDRTLGLVQGYYKTSVPGGPDHWWGTYDRSGGQVVEQATHIYDLVRMFGGEVASVSAIGSHKLVPEIDFEDVVSANLEHADGTVGQVTSTSASPRTNTGLELLGEDLLLNVTWRSVSGVVDGEEIEYTPDLRATERAVRTFVDAVRTGDDSDIRSPYSDAMRTFELTMAVEKSLATGTAVDL